MIAVAAGTKSRSPTSCSTPSQRAAWSESLAPALRDLEEGRGLRDHRPAAAGKLSQREAVALYWLYGQLLGEPFAQNVQGTLLYDVRDTGQDVASGAAVLGDELREQLSHRQFVRRFDSRLCRPVVPEDGQVGRREPECQRLCGDRRAAARASRCAGDSVAAAARRSPRRHSAKAKSPTVLRPIVAWDGRRADLAVPAVLDRSGPRESRISR